MKRTLKLGFILMASLGFFFAMGAASDLSAQPRPAEGKVDFKQLFETCEKNFSRYETELDGVRSSIQADVSKMKQEKYVELMVKDDPRIVFATAVWPKLLEEKNELWDSYEDCANMHAKTLKTLGSQTATSKTKKKAVEDLKNCLFSDIDHDRLAAPLDSMISCYEKKAN